MGSSAFYACPLSRQAAETLGLTAHDHIVIGRAGQPSFKGMGLL
jgi:DNA repair protein RadC